MVDAANFRRIYDSFQEFHAFFTPAFSRKQWRERIRNYLQALPVHPSERRNAESLSESVGVSTRVLQRFLTEARWDDDAVMGRLQEYLAPGSLTLRRCGCSTAATSSSRAGNRRG